MFMELISRLTAGGARRRRTIDATAEVDRVLQARNDPRARAAIDALSNETPTEHHDGAGGG